MRNLGKPLQKCTQTLRVNKKVLSSIGLLASTAESYAHSKFHDETQALPVLSPISILTLTTVSPHTPNLIFSSWRLHSSWAPGLTAALSALEGQRLATLIHVHSSISNPIVVFRLCYRMGSDLEQVTENSPSLSFSSSNEANQVEGESKHENLWPVSRLAVVPSITVVIPDVLRAQEFLPAGTIIQPEVLRTVKDTPPNRSYLYELKCSLVFTFLKAFNFSNRGINNMKVTNGLMTSLPQTSFPQRVFCLLLTSWPKNNMLFRALKREEEETMVRDPWPFPPLFLQDGSRSIFGGRLPLGPQVKSYH